MSSDVVILRTLVGSRGQGLATEHSDYDYAETYVAPTLDFCTLREPPKAKNRRNPDTQVIEVGHMVRLCMKGNPSALECVLGHRVDTINDDMPGDRIYSLGTYLREEIRQHAIGKTQAVGAYRGYATSQLHRYQRAGDPKSLMHFFRILHQGTELLRTGEFQHTIGDDEYREWLLNVRFGNIENAELNEQIKTHTHDFEVAVNEKSPLPLEPAREYLQEFLVEVRKEFI